jgi:hypothetical protein
MAVQYVSVCTSQTGVFSWVERFKGWRASAANDARSLLSATATFVQVKGPDQSAHLVQPTNQHRCNF